MTYVQITQFSMGEPFRLAYRVGAVVALPEDVAKAIIAAGRAIPVEAPKESKPAPKKAAPSRKPAAKKPAGKKAPVKRAAAKKSNK